MKPKFLITLGLCFSLFLLVHHSAKAQSGCCPTPDSLTVTSVTDSNFCVRWRISDTIGCNRPKGAFLAYRPVLSAVWKTVKITYDSTQQYATFCDTLTACLKYTWKVRNVCINNGDTTFTEYVKGPNFTADCDSLTFAKSAVLNGSNKMQIFPNPVRNTVTVKGTFASVSKVKVVITDLQGNAKLQREVLLVNGVLQASFDAAGWNKGAYFVTISDGKKTIKQNFIKE